jgi:predicted metalloprotease
LTFRDAPGSSANDPSAHGSAFDRISAFQDGFESGPEECKPYLTKPPTIVQLPFQSKADAANKGNIPAAQVLPLTIDLLNEFYSQVVPRYRSLTTQDVESFDSSKPSTIPKCGGSKLSVSQVKNRVFYCLDDKYIAFDEPFLQGIYDDIGDFGVASLFANAWATYVQNLQGIVTDNSLPVVLQADCYTGGWTAAFYLGKLNGSMSPGDLDEFVQAFLTYSRARGVSANVPITFARVLFFRQGFFSGYNSCDTASIKAAVAKL